MHGGEWLAVGAGVALAAACGLRAFLPLLVLGLAARGGLVHLTPSAAWLAHDWPLMALAVATVLELAADKVPVLDHALDVIGLVVRPAAAWLAAYAVLIHWPAPWGQAVALLLALIALAFQGVKAKLRLGSTAVTLGTANPVVSVLEDIAALAMSLAAVLVPILGVVLLVLLALVLRRGRRPRPT